ncbi:glycosyltransferase [Spirosoma aerophilum]
MPNFSEEIPYVILSQQYWEEKKSIGSNIWDIAEVLSKKQPVLLVNQAMDWSSLFDRKQRKRKKRNDFIKANNGQHLIQINENFWLFTPKRILGSFNWMPDSNLYDMLNRYNGYAMASEIKEIIQQLGWQDYMLLNDNDMIRGFYLKEFLNPRVYIYYLRDNLLATAYWQRHGKRMEPLLLSKVDLIVSNSMYLTEQAAQYNKRSVYIGQGCDLSIFDPTNVRKEPVDLVNIPRPRIGYIGALTQIRLDFELILSIATQRPDWQIILMGGADDSFPKKWFENLPNVTILDAKPIHVVPSYVAHMDVMINPQILNVVTIGNYPRKIDEYLAMGKPVVAVKTATMALFADHVYLAETTNEFIACIESALNNEWLSSASDRITFALEHTWENSVNLMTEAIEETAMVLGIQPEKHDEF